MSKTIINALILLLVLVLAQAVIFNNLAIFGVALPIVFIYVLISLPVVTGTNLVLTIGFLSGLAVDIFSDTPGLNSLACTIMAFVRRPVLHLYLPLDDELGPAPLGLRSLGAETYLKYMLTMVLALVSKGCTSRGISMTSYAGWLYTTSSPLRS